MNAWHFYDAATGILAPGSMQLPNAEAVAANTPPGHLPIYGELDHRRHRIDIDVPEPVAVDYQPPAPASDAMRTWQWDADAWRWRAVPTLAALIAERVAGVDADMAEAERQQQRPLGDIMAAIATGATPSQDDITRLTGLRAYVAAARAARDDMAAAQTETELAAVVWPQQNAA